jgi:citrate synthase
MESGLEDVVAAETVLSHVDGKRGELIIRGFSLDALAGRRFEEIVGLLFGGFFAALPDDDGIAAGLAAARRRAFAEIGAIDEKLTSMPTTDAVRALVARLADADDLESAFNLLGATAVFTPAVIRRKAGLAPEPPRPDLGHSADVLAMLTGRPPSPVAAAALDTYLVTVADHGLNASTFTARVIASTRAGLTSSVLGAISALKGPLHGGAPGPVLDMLDAIAVPARAEGWIEAALDRRERLMGFGHRIYRVRDPRADALKAAVRRMAAEGAIDPARFALAEAVEAAALAILRRRKPDRPLDVNVEFYTALLLEALGFPREAFTAVFAMGRTAGWIAHAREQAATQRLIRPQSVYVGPAPRAAA